MIAPKSKPSATRYSARTRIGRRIFEIAIGTESRKMISKADHLHKLTNQPCWVWNVRTGETIHRSRAVVLSQIADAQAVRGRRTNAHSTGFSKQKAFRSAP